MPLFGGRENRRDPGESGVPDTTRNWPRHPAAPGPRLSYNTKPRNRHGSFRQAKSQQAEAVDERRKRVIHVRTHKEQRRATKGLEDSREGAAMGRYLGNGSPDLEALLTSIPGAGPLPLPPRYQAETSVTYWTANMSYIAPRNRAIGPIQASSITPPWTGSRVLLEALC